MEDNGYFMNNPPIKKERKKSIRIKNEQEGKSTSAEGGIKEITDSSLDLSTVGVGATGTTTIPASEKRPLTTLTTVSIEMGRKTLSEKEKDKEKEKKPKRAPLKEKWLLTRKTWKYMTEAGRNLIPAGAHNRKEDIPKIEEYFQQICKSEPRFVLWKRKSSFPGARGTSRRWKRPEKSQLKNFRSIDESLDEARAQSQNADIALNILRDYLGIQDGSKRTTALLGATTARPDETDSPSSQRPISIPKSSTFTTTSFSSNTSSQLERQAQMARNTQDQISELLERLRSYSQSVSKPILPPDRITTDILEDKALLKRIYNDLKKQQLHRILGKHPTRSPLHLPHSSSLSNLWHFRRDGNKDLKSDQYNASSTGGTTTTIVGVPSSSGNNLQHPNVGIPLILIKKPSCEKTFNTLGTQTEFLSLNEVQRLAKEYEEKKKEEEQLRLNTDEEAEKEHNRSRRKSSIDNEDVSQSVSDTIKRYLRMARKKSVHDDYANRFKRVNYDRNLRNIRAKGEINPPGMDEDNNKATQTLDSWPLLLINYIRGIDNPKLLEDSHADWQASLQQRIKQKQEYDEQQKKVNQQHEEHSSGLFHSGTQFFANLWHGYHHTHESNNNAKCSTNVNNSDTKTSCNSATTSTVITTLNITIATTTTTATATTTTTTLTTGVNIITTSNTSCNVSNNNSTATDTTANSNLNNNCNTTTLSNNFENHKNLAKQSQIQQQSSTAAAAAATAAAMQKSKSSSNVGQFVSKKIWRSRSRSQTRTASPIKSEWTPQGNCVWATASGKRLILSDVRLQDLTEIERKILHRVAVDKINQLNLGINVTVPSEVSASNTENVPKKRRPLLIKRKALTTSFFDTGKKTEDKGGGGSGGLVFGVSLEKCVNNDNRNQSAKTTASTTVGLDRGSRNSIASLLGSSSKAGENTGSCESLPSHSSVTTIGLHSTPRNLSSDHGGNIFEYQSAAGSDQISRSQTDVHRLSQDEDELLGTAPPMVGSTRNSGQQVPALVTACINHLEEHGMHTVGIFRVSTSKKRVRQLKEDFDKGEISTLDPDICPHDVATILKEYLRDLPEPLLCRSLYKAFVKTQKIRNRRLQLEALSHLIQLLPVAHRDTLYVLLKFLAKIVRSSDDITSRDGTILSIGNKMDSSNLATVFAPNILRYSSPGRNTTEQEIDEQIDVINVIRTMIDHYEELFRVPAELVDEVYTNMMDSHPQQLNYLCEKRDIFEKYDDSLNNTGSSTPLSSPPPVNSPTMTSPPVTSPVEAPLGFEQNPPRRVYSREDFLHENAAKCETNGNLARRRERSSKMKYQESDSEVSSRRHRRDRYTGDNSVDTVQGRQQHTLDENLNRSGLNESNTGQISVQQKQHHGAAAALKSLSRRLSSPHVLQNTGIVTASLKIPVQVHSNNNDYHQQQQQQQQQQISTNHGYSGQFDLQDIPYIEDEGALSLNYNNNEAIKTSVSLRTGKVEPSQQKSNSSIFSLSGIKRIDGSKVTSTLSSPASRKFSTGEISTTNLTLFDPSNQKSHQHQSPSLHTEPKISPSITSIGGAVLRSKTADFERMLSSTSTGQKQQKKHSRSTIFDYSANYSGTSGLTVSTSTLKSSSSASPSATSASAPTNESGHERTRRSSQGPIYKRQELISSAMKSKPK